MIDNKALTRILFLDIECVSGQRTLAEIPKPLQDLWTSKAKRIMKVDELSPEESNKVYQDRAAIFVEYGKIVCISVGFIVNTNGANTLRVKSFADPDERVLLEDFANLLNNSAGNFNSFCGHNIKEFDMPYIGRRMMVHGMNLHPLIDLRGKKPWESKHIIDTMEIWAFGDRKNYTSLKLLTALFEVPSPKDDIDGSQVGHVFWEENDLDRIAIYCEKDVVATTNVFLALTQNDQIPTDNVMFVDRDSADV